MKKYLAWSCLSLALAAVPIALTGQAAVASAVEPKVDAVFAKWTTATTPGCAVGVAVGGKPALAKAYGMADLEHDVQNTARHDLRGRLGVEAVHRRGGAAAGARGQAVARRSGRGSTSPSCRTTARR